MKKRTAILTISYLCAAVIALGAWGYTQHCRAEKHAIAVRANYQHAFGELVTSLTELDGCLQKSLYATSPGTAGALCTQAFGKAMTAQMSLGVLPFSTQELEQTAGFISRVGDYAYMLSRSAAKGAGYTDEQRENLAALSDTASILAQNMLQLQADMSDGHLTMDELTSSEKRLDEAEESLPTTIGGSMRLIEQEFPETPSLIYDGPFSAHLDKAEPIFLKDLQEFSEDEALMEARELIGGKKTTVKSLGRTEGRLPTWNFSAKCGDGEMSLALSVQGGKPVSMICSRSMGEAKLSAEEAVEIAQKFLNKHGFSDMKSSYYMIQDGVITVNFAYAPGGVVCYADLVKVGVALDDGSVVSLETRGYLMNHRERYLPEVAVAEQEAAAHVGEGLEILSTQLCLVPRAGGEEVLCHEFTCQTARGQHYVVYVDAVSGEQEKILILLEDENGSLTL